MPHVGESGDLEKYIEKKERREREEGRGVMETRRRDRENRWTELSHRDKCDN